MLLEKRDKSGLESAREQGLTDSGIDVWCGYAAYKVLTKLSLSTLVRYSFLMPFAATP